MDALSIILYYVAFNNIIIYKERAQQQKLIYSIQQS